MWYYIPDYINWLLGYKNPDVSDTVIEVIETKEEVQQKNVEIQTETNHPEGHPKKKNKHRK